MRIAFDTGGTFTDCVHLHDGRIEILKVPSTPRNPAEAIAHALNKILPVGSAVPGLEISCGTTVGTNALLQRQGGRVALVTTAGFEDVLEIGRQARTRLYDLMFEKAEPLVPRNRRFGMAERLDSDGRALRSPSSAEIARIVRAVKRSRAQSVAVCLLFSFVNPAHEQAISAALASAGLQVSASHRILPEYREFERTSTTAVNAYLVPVMSEYLAEIERSAKAFSRPNSPMPSRFKHQTIEHYEPNEARVRIMQSSGGILSARAASREPVRTILSGPAGGVLGAQYVAELAGFDRIITFDMGGTSTDVALMRAGGEGSLATTSETVVSDVPVAVPMLDIHTVGAGGGSLARFDRAGALRVGPESAGADPGPICYGRGEGPTVTDANLVLGRIPKSGLLGGAFELNIESARKFMDRARKTERAVMRSVEGFAQGIVDVANAVMEKAIRVISVERGHDPRDYTLVAFGGAGAMHACDLAAALEIPRVLVPCLPGALSALGILRADVTKDLSRTVRLQVRNASQARPKLDQEFAKLERDGSQQMRDEGFPESEVKIERALDMRYSGQSYELAVPYARDYIAAFHRAHETRYGYSDRSRTCDVVNVRARFTGRTPKPALPKLKLDGPDARQAIISTGRVSFAGRWLRSATYDRAKLRAGNRIAGPAIVMEYSATTLITPGWAGRVDVYGNILLEPRR
jgi:N-methylhydantoinase A